MLWYIYNLTLIHRKCHTGDFHLCKSFYFLYYADLNSLCVIRNLQCLTNLTSSEETHFNVTEFPYEKKCIYSDNMSVTIMLLMNINIHTLMNIRKHNDIVYLYKLYLKNDFISHDLVSKLFLVFSFKWPQLRKKS